MSSMLSPGPVFVYESITASRRWQVYALRALFVLALLASLTMVVWSTVGFDYNNPKNGAVAHQMGRLGEQFYYAISLAQIALVMLAAPAATAGAVCLDRARGALTHMLVTDLSDREIVLGKLAARLAPVAALVFAAVPVLALASLLGGIIPESLLWLTAISLALAVFGCSLALAISARATKTHEVLMGVYTIWFLWVFWPVLEELVSAFVPAKLLPKAVLEWLYVLHPFGLPWELYSSPGKDGILALAIFLGVTLTASAGLLVYAVRALRKEHRPAATRRGLLMRLRERWRAVSPGPSRDGNPVVWHEWNRGRPSRLARAVWGLYIAGSLLGTTAAVVLMLAKNLEQGGEMLLTVSILEASLGLLLVSLTAPTALAEERVRGGLGVLLTTPLSTASIVSGKWWGVYQRVPELMILPAFSVVLLAIAMDPHSTMPSRQGIGTGTRIALAVLPIVFFLAQGAVVPSLGLALAVWIPRVGRAVAISVSVYLCAIVGMFIVLELDLPNMILNVLLEFQRSQGQEGLLAPLHRQIYTEIAELVTDGLYSLFPFGAVMQLFEASTTRDSLWLLAWFLQGSLLSLMILAAAGLYGLVLLTFNRCLGRVPEWSRRPTAPVRRALRKRPVRTRHRALAGRAM